MIFRPPLTLTSTVTPLHPRQTRLHDATGTGKTLLAKAAATETGATFIELKVSDVVRGEIGESEKVRRHLLLLSLCCRL